MKKKILAISLILCLIFTLSPLVVFAEENGDEGAAVSAAEAGSESEYFAAAEGEANGEIAAENDGEGENEGEGEGEGDGDDPVDPPFIPIPMESMTLVEKSLTMKACDVYQLTLKILPADATETEITWTTSNPKAAVVDENGVVTAIGLGTATITASHEGLVQKCTVNVKYFADVDEGKYYYKDVYWALDKGITAGTSSAYFSPNKTCTRAEAVSFIYRVNGSPAVSGSIPFTDVSAKAYYYKAIVWAYKNEIVAGTSKTQFSPNKTCTRGEIMSFIWRCKRQWPANRASFSDVASGKYYFYPIAWAKEKNIAAGISKTKFCPNQSCTRAEIIAFLHRCESGKNAILNKSSWQLYYPKAEAVLDSVGRDLKKAFNWSSYLTYYGHGAAGMPDKPDPGSEWFANYGFTNKKGNCYVMAATFWEMAVCLGYDTRQMTGYVPLVSGSLGPHSWVEINVGGKTYVCDPDFAYNTRKRGNPRNGYLINYGQTGTWRYTSYKAMSR